MNTKETYEAIVAEVNESKGLIKEDVPEYGSYLEAVQDEGRGSTTVSLPNDITSLSVPTSVFSDYKLRDAVIAKSMDDEEFAFVLVNKIAGAVLDNDKAGGVTQDDIEALALVANVTCVWEQFNHSLSTLEAIGNLTKDNDLDIPTLAQLTVKILESVNDKGFPFEATRASGKAILAKIEADFNTNTEGE